MGRLDGLKGALEARFHRLEGLVASPQKSTFMSRTSQFLAALFLPFLIVILMAVTSSIYLAITQLLFSGGLNGTPIAGFLSFLIAVTLVISIPVACFFWVKTAGFSLLRMPE